MPTRPVLPSMTIASDQLEPSALTLMVQIVVAGQADLRPARKSGLEEQAGGIGGRVLVDLMLMAGAGMIEERCRRGNGQSIGRVGCRIDADHGHVLQQPRMQLH